MSEACRYDTVATTIFAHFVCHDSGAGAEWRGVDKGGFPRFQKNVQHGPSQPESEQRSQSLCQLPRQSLTPGEYRMRLEA